MLVSVNGAELYYSTRGTGVPCIVPCIIGVKPYERLTPPPLTDFFQFIYVDLRGGGKSTGDPSDLTFDVLAADLEAVRKALGFERVVVLGYSILGVLVLEYGRRCPDAVSHVIMAGTPPSGDIPKLVQAGTAFFEAGWIRGAQDDPERELREAPARHAADASGLCANTVALFRPSVRCDAAVRGGGLQAATVSARPRTADGELGRDD